VKGVTFERFAALLECHHKRDLRNIERAFGVDSRDTVFCQSLTRVLWGFYRVSLSGHIRNRAAYKAAVSAAADHGEKFAATMSELWNANDPAAVELWMWREARTDSGISSDLIAILRRQADTLPDGPRNGRPPATAFAALMRFLHEHHMALCRVSIVRQRMAGTPPPDVAAYHGISVDEIERLFAHGFDGLKSPDGDTRENGTTIFWDLDSVNTADVVPYDFVNVARAVTRLLRAFAPRLGVNFRLPKNNDAALDKQLQRLALWSPRPNSRRR
jgi:hypothetical protein